MPNPLIGNQQVFSGNYGEAFFNNTKLFGFKNWTANYSVNLSPEGQIGTGTPILVPGLISVTLTVSKLMMFDQSLSLNNAFEPSDGLNNIANIPPFTAKLYDGLAKTMIKALWNCIFDSNSINAAANGAYIETVTIMGTDAQGTGGMTNA